MNRSGKHAEQDLRAVMMRRFSRIERKAPAFVMPAASGGWLG